MDLEPTPLERRLGAGSFASVYSTDDGGLYAYKIVHSIQDGEILEHEYDALRAIFTTANRFFSIPHPWALYQPEIGTVVLDPTSANVNHEVFRSAFRTVTRPTYAMDKVPSLPPAVGDLIRDLYYPPLFKTAPRPHLCRLYFGKVIRPNRHSKSMCFNSDNFPLDVARYDTLRRSVTCTPLPTAREVATGMGQMLGYINAKGGFDGRDIEFVMGGDGQDGVSFFVIDFNQMKKWDKKSEDVDKVVSAFFANDPYYPRPVPGDELYDAFTGGYLAEYGSENKELGEAVLLKLQEEQARRVNARTNG